MHLQNGLDIQYSNFDIFMYICVKHKAERVVKFVNRCVVLLMCVASYSDNKVLWIIDILGIQEVKVTTVSRETQFPSCQTFLI